MKELAIDLGIYTALICVVGMLLFSYTIHYEATGEYKEMRRACENYPDIVYTCRVACPLFNITENELIKEWNEHYNEAYQRPTQSPRLPPTAYINYTKIE